MGFRTRRIWRTALVVFCVVLALEVLLRIVGHHCRNRYWSQTAAEAAYSGDDITILAIGESTTAGIWVPIRDSYPKQLEHLLRAHFATDRIHVVIPPHIGQNTSQMVRNFDCYLRTFRPKLVIIMAGVNNEWSLAQSNLGEFIPWSSWRKYGFLVRCWTDDIKLIRLVRLLLPSSREHRNPFRADLEGHPRFTKWPPEPDPFVRGIGTEVFMRLWRSDIDKMINATKSSGADIILMTYPNYDSPPVFEFIAMAEKHSVPLVDNHRSFALLIEVGRAQEVLLSDYYHPNAMGYGIVASNALTSIIRSGFLDEAVTKMTSAQQAPRPVR